MAKSVSVFVTPVKFYVLTVFKYLCTPNHTLELSSSAVKSMFNINKISYSYIKLIKHQISCG